MPKAKAGLQLIDRQARVTLPAGAWKIIDEKLKGVIGDDDSEIISNIIIAHLAEPGYSMATGSRCNTIERIMGELNMHDAMIEALVEELEAKKVLRAPDWESRIEKKLVSNDVQDHLGGS